MIGKGRIRFSPLEGSTAQKQNKIIWEDLMEPFVFKLHELELEMEVNHI